MTTSLAFCANSVSLRDLPRTKPMMHVGRHGDMHTEPSHGATIQAPPHRHLNRTGSYAATSDPRRRSHCAWGGTTHDAAAATSRCSDVSPQYIWLSGEATITHHLG